MQPCGDFSQKPPCKDRDSENTAANNSSRSTPVNQTFVPYIPNSSSLPAGFTTNLLPHGSVVSHGQSYRDTPTPRRKQVRRIRLLYPPCQPQSAPPHQPNPPCPSQPPSTPGRLDAAAVPARPPSVPPSSSAHAPHTSAFQNVLVSSTPLQVLEKHPTRYTGNVHDAIARLQTSKQPILVFKGGPRPVVTTGGGPGALTEVHQDPSQDRSSLPPQQPQACPGGLQLINEKEPSPGCHRLTKRPRLNTSEVVQHRFDQEQHGPEYFKGLLVVCALLCLASASKAAGEAEAIITNVVEFGLQQQAEVFRLCAQADASIDMYHEFQGFIAVYAPDLVGGLDALPL